MLDIKKLRNDFEKTAELLSRRNKNYNLDEFKRLDEKRRQLISQSEKLKNHQNETSKDIAKLKAVGQNVDDLLNEMKIVAENIKNLEPQLRELDSELENFMLSIPNTPHESVPVGNSDSDNLQIRSFKTPTKFDFEPKAHWELCQDLFNPNAAAKTTGTRFMFYKGAGAKLERAIVNFMLDIHTQEHGYTEIFPPFIVHRRSMIGTGQLPKFEEDAFKLDGTDYFLIPTAEVPVTNMHRDEILDGAKLPLKYCAYTACFRAEAGSAGRDTRGLIRQHQFNKVELVKFVRPENSYDELEKLTADAEDILKILDLPYRVVKLCTGDLGFTSAMTYDIEVWLPSYNRYVEISSCSNFEDFQARRANIKFKDEIKDKARFVHTLNGSGLAVGRTTAAIIENYQMADGKIKIPDALVPYMNGQKFIS